MWPLSISACQIACEALAWRGSVVRMNASLEKFIAFASSRKFSDTRSVKTCGSMPAAWADFSTFWPCSSVPVRKNTS